MRPVSPATGAMEITLAKDQPQYEPLPVAIYGNNSNLGPRTLLSRWQLTDEERAAIAAGADIYVGCVTFGRPLQPLIVQVGAQGWDAVFPEPSGEDFDMSRCSSCGGGPLEKDETGAPFCIDCGAA